MTSSEAMPHGAPVGRTRWTICALLFAATTINYMDRSILGVLGPTLQYKVFQWSDQDWANINIAFKVAYAIGLLSMGAIIDRLGTKLGYTVAIVTWSFFGMMHAAVRPAFSLIGFCVARFGLGLGEAGNFPAAIKTVAEWFPRKERALATGILNAGSNVGAILAPLVIPLVVATDGTNWQYAFLTTGFFSAVWVLCWLKFYHRPEQHPSVTPAEREYILSDSAVDPDAGKSVSWWQVVRVRETWAFAAAKLPDAVWWFYLFWGGKFLYDQFGLSIKGLALPLVTIYLIADIGSVAGGWLSSAFIKRGWPVNRARKVTLLLCATAILPVMFATQFDTTFTVNPRFFERVGETAVAKAGQPMPAEMVTGLHTLDGKTFASAKEFLKAASQAVSPAKLGAFESTAIESARSDSMYWFAVLLIALAAAGHQAWSANVFTLVSDVFPKRATASVTGIGGMVGAIAGIIADKSLATVLSSAGPSGYFFAFLIAGLLYPVVVGVIHLLMPRMEPVRFS